MMEQNKDYEAIANKVVNKLAIDFGTNGGKRWLLTTSRFKDLLAVSEVELPESELPLLLEICQEKWKQILAYK